jgi:hypothetical protein
MERIDPANTNLRMVREFLQKKYYGGNVIPRLEQRQLLYKLKPIFDAEGDYNLDDAKTLADHGLTKDCTIDLAPMHVNVLSPSTGRSMIVNNVDPMNDVIFDVRKLALEDGYPIERLRVFHKEGGDKEILKADDSMTFFSCGVKHNHTLVLEWPKIVVKVKLPIPKKPDSSETSEEGQEILQENGRYYKLVDFHTQPELEKVRLLNDFITKHTDIPFRQQKLVAAGKPKKNKPLKTKKIDDPTKKLADFKIEEGDIIKLVPRQLKINLVASGDAEKKQTTLEYVYLSDTIESIKDRIANGEGEADGIPAIPKANVSVKKSADGTELKRNSETLLLAGIKDDDELDIEKTK